MVERFRPTPISDRATDAAIRRIEGELAELRPQWRDSLEVDETNEQVRYVLDTVGSKEVESVFLAGSTTDYPTEADTLATTAIDTDADGDLDQVVKDTGGTDLSVPEGTTAFVLVIYKSEKSGRGRIIGSRRMSVTHLSHTYETKHDPLAYTSTQATIDNAEALIDGSNSGVTLQYKDGGSAWADAPTNPDDITVSRPSSGSDPKTVLLAVKDGAEHRGVKSIQIEPQGVTVPNFFEVAHDGVTYFTTSATINSAEALRDNNSAGETLQYKEGSGSWTDAPTNPDDLNFSRPSEGSDPKTVILAVKDGTDHRAQTTIHIEPQGTDVFETRHDDITYTDTQATITSAEALEKGSTAGETLQYKDGTASWADAPTNPDDITVNRPSEGQPFKTVLLAVKDGVNHRGVSSVQIAPKGIEEFETRHGDISYSSTQATISDAEALKFGSNSGITLQYKDGTAAWADAPTNPDNITVNRPSAGGDMKTVLLAVKDGTDHRGITSIQIQPEAVDVYEVQHGDVSYTSTQATVSSAEAFKNGTSSGVTLQYKDGSSAWADAPTNPDDITVNRPASGSDPKILQLAVKDGTNHRDATPIEIQPQALDTTDPRLLDVDLTEEVGDPSTSSLTATVSWDPSSAVTAGSHQVVVKRRVYKLTDTPPAYTTVATANDPVTTTSHADEPGFYRDSGGIDRVIEYRVELQKDSDSSVLDSDSRSLVGTFIASE